MSQDSKQSEMPPTPSFTISKRYAEEEGQVECKQAHLQPSRKPDSSHMTNQTHQPTLILVCT
jgi:hypothetical protein